MAILDEIQNIVIVMMENRSFDHLLGYRSLPPFNHKDVDGLKTVKKWVQKYSNRDGDLKHPPFHSQNPHSLPEEFDPPHERSDIAAQMGPPREGIFPMNGFVSSLPQHVATKPEDRGLVMEYFGPEEVPVTHFLAENFAICDNWFCSLPAGTQANRLMAMSGQSMIDKNTVPLPNQKLVYDWLNERKVSWRVYHQGIPFFALMPSWIPEIVSRRNFRNFRDLHSDLSDTPPWELPQVIFIEPTYGDAPRKGPSTDDHAPSGVSFGQEFLMQIYNAVTTSETFWKQCLVVVTYDEHGGFFDHVSPPLIKTPSPSPKLYKDFESLGVRVPAHIISPFVKKGSVHKGVLDHTSILKLLGQKFADGHYSPAVDKRDVGSVADVLTNKVSNVPSPAVPPVDDYMNQRPPKPVGVTIPPQNTALQIAFSNSLAKMQEHGATAEDSNFGDLISAIESQQKNNSGPQ